MKCEGVVHPFGAILKLKLPHSLDFARDSYFNPRLAITNADVFAAFALEARKKIRRKDGGIIASWLTM